MRISLESLMKYSEESLMLSLLSLRQSVTLIPVIPATVFMGPVSMTLVRLPGPVTLNDLGPSTRGVGFLMIGIMTTTIRITSTFN